MLCIHENKCWLWCNWGIKVNLIKYIPIMHSHPTLLRLFFCHLWEYFSIKFIFLSFIQNYPTEGNNRGWDGWMASPTQWTWVWANSGRQWRTVACCRPRGLKSRTWLGNWTATTVSFYHVFLCLSLKYFLSVLILQPWVHEKRRLTKCTADVLYSKRQQMKSQWKHCSMGLKINMRVGSGRKVSYHPAQSSGELKGTCRHFSETQRPSFPSSHFIGTLLKETSINSLVKLMLNLHRRFKIWSVYCWENCLIFLRLPWMGDF